MNSFNFQIVPVANLAAIVTPFPDHICYFTEDTENYYIWENNALKEIFVDASSITWNNVTNKPTTITGFGITDAVKVSGSTLNYVAKFTPDGTTVGNSQIQDDGSVISIGSTIYSDSKFSVNDNTKTHVLHITNSKTTGANFGATYKANGIGSSSNVALQGESSGGTGENWGLSGSATGASLRNVGVRASASGATNNYSVWLLDGTQTNGGGKYLRDMGYGLANWANINITEVTNGLSSTLLGAPNGIATLDNNSKLVMSQMPITVMDYKGTFNPTVPSPALQDGVGNTGDVYAVTAAGTYTFGNGNTLTLGVGDWVIYNGTKWEKTLGNNVGAGTVTSVGLTTGTTGTDVNVSNSPITTTGSIALNIPTIGDAGVTRGLLSIADWTTFNSKVSAVSGTNNYIAKFTPDGTTIGNSLIRDNGTAVGVNMAPNANAMFFVTGGTQTNTIAAQSNVNNGVAINGQAFTGTGTLIGVSGFANSSTATNNIGLYGRAMNGASNYSIQLIDGTETVAGRFLKNMTTDGKANWANITVADVSGAVGAVSGTNNYIAKFTPNGTTIGNSQIQDNGSRVGIGTSGETDTFTTIRNSTYNITTGSFNTTITGTNKGSYSGATGVGASFNYGSENYASGATGVNAGSVNKSLSNTGTSIGAICIAQGTASKYAIQLQDGTEAQNKFLKSISSDGSSNWAYLPDSAQIMMSDMTSAITADAVTPKSFWVAPCNGKLTDIFSNLYSPQAGGSSFTIRINMNGAQIATLTHTNGQFQSTPATVSNTFTKGVMFEVFVTQIGDGSAKGLLTTINYERT